MIYIFNSAFRPNYAQNIIRTLFFPNGWINTYRYRCRGERTNIHTSMVDDLKNAKQYSEVVITYIDRFYEEDNVKKYFYHPIRRGKLLKCEEIGGKLFFTVILGDFIYPHNPVEISNKFGNSLNYLPKLTNNNPEETNDGSYALVENDITNESQSFYTGEKAWDHITDSFKNLEAFKIKENAETIFVRGELYKANKSENIIKPIINNDEVYYEIIKAQKYRFKMFYKYPNQYDENKAKLEIKSGSNLKILSNDIISIDNYTNFEFFNLSTIRYVEVYYDKIDLLFKPSAEKYENLLAPNESLTFKLKESQNFWFQIILAIIVFSVSGLLIATDLRNMPEITLKTIFQEIHWIRLLSSFMQGLMLFWIFRLLGKKVL